MIVHVVHVDYWAASKLIGMDEADRYPRLGQERRSNGWARSC